MKSLIMLALVVTAFLFQPLRVEAENLLIMAEEYPPYSYKDNGRPAGFMVEIVELIQQRLGEKPTKISFYPWARGYKKLLTGTGDVLFPMGMTPERSSLFKFVGPVFWDDVYFYKARGSSVEIASLDDAKKIGRIAVTRDDLYCQNLSKMGFTNLNISSSQRCDVVKLIKGRVDLMPMGRKSISFFLKGVPEVGPEDVERVGPPVFFTTAYIAFAAKTPDDVIQRWQEVLEQLKSEGILHRIIDKYYPPE